MKPSPWNLDAFRYFSGDEAENHLLVNQPIREFLTRIDKFFLIGAKGLGKTLFLRYKSHNYLNEYGDSIKFNASQAQLTENLDIHANTFAKEELLKFQHESLWSLLWQLALWTMVFRICKEPINPKLDRIIDHASSLSPILARLLNNRKNIGLYKEFLTEYQDKRHLIQSGVMLFIDDVDQALHNFLRVDHPSDGYYEGERNPSVETWISAQMGLIGAIYNMSRQNTHIKIYATIRREAFEGYDGELKINYEQHAVKLSYNKEEIKEIFLKNIQLIDNQLLINKTSNNPFERFLGFENMPHGFATDANGLKRDENVFDFIYRHTYGRPREIVKMGYEIYSIVTNNYYTKFSHEERIKEIRAKVNRESHDLFLQYCQEIIPFFSIDELSGFVDRINGNVITKEELSKINQQTLRLYINLGLVGYTRSENHKATLIQEFRPPAIYNYRVQDTLPDSEYFLVHSSLDTTLLRHHPYGQFYNKYNIIGNGYPFYPQIAQTVYKFDYYLPHEVSGNRMNALSEAGGHPSFPLAKYYKHCFQFDDEPNRPGHIAQQYIIAENILSLLSKICMSYRLEKQFKEESYSKKRSEFFLEMSKYHYMRKYNSVLKEAMIEKDLDKFIDKLIGRFITLGSYLFLDMRITWIHDLFRTGKFAFTPEPNEASFSYITRSFFIRDIRREEPRELHNPLHRSIKQSIFKYLSRHEQDCLTRFAKNAIDEVAVMDWLEDKSHVEWLRENVLNKIWQPE